MTTTQKIKVLAQNDEDYEWYPTTEEILSAMNNDLHHLFEGGASQTTPAVDTGKNSLTIPGIATIKPKRTSICGR
jgi:hypothetical protein